MPLVLYALVASVNSVKVVSESKVGPFSKKSVISS